MHAFMKIKSWLKPQASRRPRTTRLQMEALEDRTAPASLNMTTGALTITGTSYDDTFRIQQIRDPQDPNGWRLEIRQSGRTTQSFDWDDVRSITLNANGGNDTLDVNSIRKAIPVSINMGSGRDIVNLCSDEWRFDAVYLTTMTIRGGDTPTNQEYDRLFVYNQLGFRNTTINRDYISATDNDPITQPIRYFGMDYVEFTGKHGDDIIDVLGTPPVFTGSIANWDGVQLRINAGLGNDTINVGNIDLELAEVVAGALEVNGQEGNDTLNLRDDSSANVTFYTLTSSRVQHNLIQDIRYDTENLILNCGWRDNWITVDESVFWRYVTVNAGGGNDYLNVENIYGNNWYLWGDDAGDVNSLLYFDNVESLQGGEVEDNFFVSMGALFHGSIDGSLGVDTLDYSAFTTGVSVNLSTGAATAVTGAYSFERVTGGWGNDNITGDWRDNILRGGAGRDTLNGGAGADILLGEAGNDELHGSHGHDILIGGLGADVLEGGSDEDILIGGYTQQDPDNAALLNIQLEWLGSGDYGQRIVRVRPLLNVHADVNTDSLTGGWLTGADYDDDWFFADKTRYIQEGPWGGHFVWADRVTDQEPGEQVERVG